MDKLKRVLSGNDTNEEESSIINNVCIWERRLFQLNNFANCWSICVWNVVGMNHGILHSPISQCNAMLESVCQYALAKHCNVYGEFMLNIFCFFFSFSIVTVQWGNHIELFHQNQGILHMLCGWHFVHFTGLFSIDSASWPYKIRYILYAG